MKLALRRVAGVGLCSLAFLLSAPTLSAGASMRRTQDITPPTIPAGTPVSTAVAGIQQAINSRLQKLSTLSNAVAAATTLVTSDRSALNLMISSETTGLTALGQKVGNETTLVALRADAATMVTTYHVYSFVDPVVGIVISVDASLHGASLLSSQEAALRAAITAAQQAKQSGGQALTLFATLQHKVSLIESEVSDTNAALLALDPSSVPGSLPTIEAAHDAADRAANQLDDANAALSAIVDLLASASPSGAHRSFNLQRAA